MRKITSLSDGWQFLKHDMPVFAALQYASQGEAVTLPHTWNAADGQDGGNDYYRGNCVYVRSLKEGRDYAAPEDGSRVFLEINGGGHKNEVYLNETLLCRHEGGYQTFRVDLTEHLETENKLVIFVSNEDMAVYPQKADFTFYGGLYRSVNLIEVPAEHFELIKDGTPGLKVTPKVDLEAHTATVTVETWQNADEVTVTIAPWGSKKEGSGIREENILSETVRCENGKACAIFTLENPHLWDGMDDPFLYRASASLASGDVVSCRFGIRTFNVDAEKGFFLNGRRYPLRGVSRHQDRRGKGNALSVEDHQEDLALIKEIGANTIRLAHYQQAQEFYDLCDEEGLVVWAEIPYITMHMKEARENTLQQMRELVTQCYHHPSIVVWGLSNEITAASAVDEDLLENHRLLNDLCHRMDETRLTVMANVFMLEIDSPLLTIPDINSYNLYFGWYLGEMDQTDAFFDEYHAKYPERVIGFSEYGADANPKFHSPDPQRSDYTEEYQALYHEHMIRLIQERPYLWATHVWNMFDFAADGRDEGGEHGLNQKGLITIDRKIKKDAFFAYQAAWSKTPMVHVCGSRYVDRAEETTRIKVYSNCETVDLYVNGEKAASMTAQEAEGFENAFSAGKAVFNFRIPLEGEAEVRAEGLCASFTEEGTAAVKDTIKIRRVEEANPEYIYNKSAGAVVNWFDDSLDPTCFSVQDTFGELLNDPKAGAVVSAMMEKAAASRGDVANSVKDNPALLRMMSRMTMISLLKQAGTDEETVKQLNRILQGIPKK